MYCSQFSNQDYTFSFTSRQFTIQHILWIYQHIRKLKQNLSVNLLFFFFTSQRYTQIHCIHLLIIRTLSFLLISSYIPLFQFHIFTTSQLFKYTLYDTTTEIYHSLSTYSLCLYPQFILLDLITQCFLSKIIMDIVTYCIHIAKSASYKFRYH